MPAAEGISLQYAVRRGRISASQSRTLSGTLPDYEVVCNGPVDWGQVFGRFAPLAVEIGAGSGEHVLAHAKAYPGIDHVAIDTYLPGLCNLAKALEREGIGNVRLARATAQETLGLAFADGSIDLAYVLFPDPWPKRRHHKRRLLSPGFAGLLAGKLGSGGLLVIVSDWPHYVREIALTLDVSERFERANSALPRPAQTRYERKAIREGRRVAEMCYRRNACRFRWNGTVGSAKDGN